MTDSPLSRIKLPGLLLAGGIAVAAAFTAALATSPAAAQAASGSDYRNKISNNMRACAPGGGPAVRVTVAGIRSATGTVRVQSYRGTKADWLEKGKWIHRIELPARKGTMTFCMPVPEAGAYAIAARHDTNGNGKTDITQDGGAMSGNPSINIFNLGRPSIEKTRFEATQGVTRLSITMLYFG